MVVKLLWAQLYLKVELMTLKFAKIHGSEQPRISRSTFQEVLLSFQFKQR